MEISGNRAANILNYYYRLVEKAKESREENKLIHALKRVSKELVKITTDINEAIEDKTIELASTDDKKKILKDEKGAYIYTTEDNLTLVKFIRSVKNKEHEITPYIATEIPYLSLDEITLLEGVVIPENYENEIKK